MSDSDKIYQKSGSEVTLAKNILKEYRGGKGHFDIRNNLSEVESDLKEIFSLEDPSRIKNDEEEILRDVKSLEKSNHLLIGAYELLDDARSRVKKLIKQPDLQLNLEDTPHLENSERALKARLKNIEEIEEDVLGELKAEYKRIDKLLNSLESSNLKSNISRQKDGEFIRELDEELRGIESVLKAVIRGKGLPDSYQDEVYDLVNDFRSERRERVQQSQKESRKQNRGRWRGIG